MKKRLICEIKRGILLLLAAAALVFIFAFTKRGVPCPFYTVTGLLCPSCGATRMVMSLLKLDFYGAYSYNKALFLSLPVLIFAFLYQKWVYIKTGSRSLKPAIKVILWAEIAFLLVFGAVRNII